MASVKYVWVEETVPEEIFEYLEGDEILDAEGNPLDPPEYYDADVPYDPPQYEDIPTGNGEVVGINRSPGEGERVGSEPSTFYAVPPPNGYNPKYYEVVAEKIKIKSQEDQDALNEADVKTKNAQKAEQAQTEMMREVQEDDLRKSFGIPGKMSEADKQTRKEYIKGLQGEIDTPSTDPAYNPPLPPGVTPPSYNSLNVTVKREEGWQGNLGWRAVITSADEAFEPTSLAISVHTGANCEGYKYTTGAFQQDPETMEWYAICPPGQEPGDADEFMGLLYAAAQLSCFTLPAGQEGISVYVYEEYEDEDKDKDKDKDK